MSNPNYSNLNSAAAATSVPGVPVTIAAGSTVPTVGGNVATNANASVSAFVDVQAAFRVIASYIANPTTGPARQNADAVAQAFNDLVAKVNAFSA